MTQLTIQLPSPEAIASWQNLSVMPITETIPRAVPIEGDISFPVEDEYEELLGLKANTTCGQTLQYVKTFNQTINSLNEQISLIYPIRSFSKSLTETLRNGSNSEDKKEEIKQLAFQNLTSLVQILTTEQKTCLQAVNDIYNCFMNIDFWNRGFYCDLLLEKIIEIIYKLVSLDRLCSSKSGMILDITNLCLLAGAAGKTTEIQNIRFWVSQNSAAQSTLVNLLAQEKDKPNEVPKVASKDKEAIPLDHLNHIFSIFYKKIYELITFKRYLNAENVMTNIVTLCVLLDIFQKRTDVINSFEKKKKEYLLPNENEVKQFLLSFRTIHPSILLIYELSVDFYEICICSNLVRTQNIPKVDETVDLNYIKQQIKGYSHEINSNLFQKTLVILPQTFQFVSEAIQIFRKLILDRSYRLKKTNDKDTRAGYEIAMDSFNKNELENILYIMTAYKTIQDQINSQFIKLTQQIANQIQKEIQDFSKNQLELIMKNLIKAPEFRADFERIRLLSGYFPISDGEDLNPPKFVQRNTDCPSSAPHLAVIELLRCSLQVMTNPEAPLMTKKIMAAKFKPEDVEVINKFLSNSIYYSQLLKLQTTFDECFDQSSLYFKEILQDQSQRQYFTVTASLPYKLTEYAISVNEANPSQGGPNTPSVPRSLDQEVLVSSVFYPMTIYEDAASCALKKLKSQMMFNEIQMESQCCLRQITYLLSTFAYQSIRSFIKPRTLESYAPACAHKKLQNEPTKQVAILLQQNQLQLMGNHYDLKGYIATSLDYQFNEDVSDLIKLINNIGLTGILTFYHQLAFLKDNHQYFLDHGIPLTTFNDFLRRNIRDDSADSATSELINPIIIHTKNVFLPNYAFCTTPIRFLPSDDVKVENYLKNTIGIVGIDHFREFNTFCGDGATYLLFQAIEEVIPEFYNKFLTIYQQIYTVSRRIVDLPIDSGVQGAFERYQNEYKQFINEALADNFFKSLQAIGNCIAFAQMLDLGSSKSHLSTNIQYSYLEQITTKDPTAINEDFYSLFDGQFGSFKKFFQNKPNFPTKNDLSGKFMKNIVQQIVKLTQDNLDLFKESSSTITDFPTLTGFASIWSVMEFVYCLKESLSTRIQTTNTKNAKQSTSKQTNAKMTLANHGEGVMIGAAIILYATNQTPLANVCSIGRKIEAHSRVNQSLIEGSSLEKYLGVYNIESNAMKLAISLVSNIQHLNQE